MRIYVVLETDDQPDYHDSIVMAFVDKARAEAFAANGTKASRDSGRLLPLKYYVEEIELDETKT